MDSTTKTTSRTSASSTVFERRLRGALFAFALCAAAPARAGAVHAAIATPDGAPVADAVVVLTPLSGQTVADAHDTAIVDQIDKEFVPYVTPIQVGTQVHFPNKDNIRHQVYSFSPAKRFELPLYSGTPSEPVLFDKTGVVTLGCNIHDWMIGYIYVAESPWFAKSGSDGGALIADAPAGRYRARVWHPLMVGAEDDTAKEIDVGPDGTVDLRWQIALKPDLRPHRAPASRDQGYR